MTAVPEAARTLRPDDIQNGLTYAHSLQGTTTFQVNELRALGECNYAQCSLLTGFFEKSLRQVSQYDAEAGYAGSLFGSYVIRKAAEAGSLDYSEVVHRWSRLYGARCLLTYPTTLGSDEHTLVLGEELAAAVGEINTERARTMFTAVIDLSFNDSPLVTDSLMHRIPVDRSSQRQRRSALGSFR